MSNNPYVQVAMTYVRRPFSSWPSSIMFTVLLLMLVPQLRCVVLERTGEFAIQHLMFFLFLFVFYVLHVNEQFADARSHLMPGFRRPHATVAAVVALIFAVLLPAMFTWASGWHSIGFVAMTTLTLGCCLWMLSLAGFVMVAACTMFVVWLVVMVTESEGYLQQFVSGQFEPQAIALFMLGLLMAVFAGTRLIRLHEDMPAYRTRTQWDWSGKNPMPRQAWAGEGRIFPWLWDWMAEKQIASVSRHARLASVSWWSRICRWQVGMVTGWSLGFWILCAVVNVQLVTWWITAKSFPNQSAQIGFVSMILNFLPMVATMTVIPRRTGMFGRELLMPVDRKSYIRQLGAAVALNHFQLWGGASIALALWYLLTNINPQTQHATFSGMLAFSGAFQVGAFGILVWTAQYCSRWLNALAMMSLLMAAPVFGVGLVTFPPVWIGGAIALAGLLITFDAYRRWLKTDFD